MNDDHLIFGRYEPGEAGETGDVDVEELLAVLAATPDAPVTEDVEPPPSRRREPGTEVSDSRRRHRVWLIIAVVVLVVIVAALAAGFVIWRSTAGQVPDYQGSGGTEVIVLRLRKDGRATSG